MTQLAAAVQVACHAVTAQCGVASDKIFVTQGYIDAEGRRPSFKRRPCRDRTWSSPWSTVSAKQENQKPMSWAVSMPQMASNHTQLTAMLQPVTQWTQWQFDCVTWAPHHGMWHADPMGSERLRQQSESVHVI